VSYCRRYWAQFMVTAVRTPDIATKLSRSSSLPRTYTSQLLCFCTLSVVMFLIKAHISESGFRVRIQVERTQLGPIDIVPISRHQHKKRYIPAQHKPSARVKANVKKLDTHEAYDLCRCTISRLLLLKSECYQNRHHH
jgi:hypothetical protein